MSQKHIELTISRECEHVLRGMAIILIALHNFCHLVPGVTQENEFYFYPDNLVSIMAPKETALQWTFDILSFFGWYGVPVFMFLTGYGLVMKYERGGAPLITGRFLKHNYLKLLFLMLPGIAAFILISLCTAIPQGHIGAATIANFICQLSMLPDVVYPWWEPYPGVYWYFGLTMEFYLVYALLIYRRHEWWVWTCVALSLVLQLIFYPDLETFLWIRHNVTGWATVFVMGVIYGRAGNIRRSVAIAIAVISAILILPSMLNWLTWQFSILGGVIIAVLGAKWSMTVPGWRNFWIWVGRLSPMLFVAHPVARSIILKAFDLQHPSWLPLLLYIGLSFVLALAFRLITNAACRRRLKP